MCNNSSFISSCVADNKEFHSPASESDSPFLYCVLAVPNDKVRLQTFLYFLFIYVTLHVI